MPHLKLINPRPQQPLTERFFHEWTLPSGERWAAFYRLKDQYLVRLRDLADFTLSFDGSNITAYPVPGVSDQTIEHLYLNIIVPLALSRQFKLVLHGSAVEIADSAVAFVGASGRGKSTLAAAFSTGGYRFLSDDGLQIDYIKDSFIIQPGHPSIRLWDDSREALIPEITKVSPEIDYTPKARLLADECVVFCKQPRPLKYVYFLGDDDPETILITPLKGQEVIVALAQNSFLLDMEEKELLTHQFKQLSALAQRPIFFRLNYPRRYEILPQVREAIVAHAQDGAERRAS